MTALLLATAIRLLVVATFIGPPARSADEAIDDRIEQYLRGGWTLCGDGDAMARVKRVSKRIEERARRLTPSRDVR
jgi:hypothetical protein